MTPGPRRHTHVAPRRRRGRPRRHSRAARSAGACRARDIGRIGLCIGPPASIRCRFGANGRGDSRVCPGPESYRRGAAERPECGDPGPRLGTDRLGIRVFLYVCVGSSAKRPQPRGATTVSVCLPPGGQALRLLVSRAGSLPVGSRAVKKRQDRRCSRDHARPGRCATARSPPLFVP